MDEIWKVVGGFPNYMISNHGRVKSLNFNKTKKEKILRLNNVKGYLQVQLYDKPINAYCKVHKLVALGFIPNRHNKQQVNHIDGNKSNNHFSNLEWVSCKENINHAFKIGLRKVGEGHPRSKISNEDVKNIRLMRGIKTQKQLSEIYGLKQPQISAIQLNQAWKSAL